MLRNLPGVTKNILYINIVLFLATWLFAEVFNQLFGLGPHSLLGLFYFDSPLFKPHQLITHMFMHGGLFHILINMFMLVMFGSLLERVWGPQRFFIFYFFTGFGALFLHQAVQAFEIQQLIGSIGFSPDSLSQLCIECCGGNVPGCTDSMHVKEQAFQCDRDLAQNYLTPTVGASGAIYGLLIAFGYLFPNTELMLIFFPMPIKAKYLIPVLIAFELFLGVTSMRGGSNIAHFAHLGGALFGFLLLKYWGASSGGRGGYT